MGWSRGYDANWDRPIGYDVKAECDHPDCHAQINRGLSHVCGGEPYGGDRGCGLYFCKEHLVGNLCDKCHEEHELARRERLADIERRVSMCMLGPNGWRR